MTEPAPAAQYATACDAEEAASSELERSFDTWLNRFGRDLPKPERNYVFHPTRGWEIDRAWPELKVGVEIQGAIWTQGAHTRGRGYIRDVDKLNAAQLHGWTLFWVTSHHLDNEPEEIFRMIRTAIYHRYVLERLFDSVMNGPIKDSETDE